MTVNRVMAMKQLEFPADPVNIPVVAEVLNTYRIIVDLEATV